MNANGVDNLVPTNTTERVRAYLDAEPHLTRTELGKRLGISPDSIDGHLRKLGLKPATKWHNPLKSKRPYSKKPLAPELKDVEQALLTANHLLQSDMNKTMRAALAKAAVSVLIEEATKLLKHL